MNSANVEIKLDILCEVFESIILSFFIIIF